MASRGLYRQLARAVAAAGQRASSSGAAAALPVCRASSSMGQQASACAFIDSASLTQRSLHSSSLASQEVTAKPEARPPSVEPPRKYRPLADKEMWHEAWMYEDKFGTENDPIWVPSLEKERIIGVTDPEDDNIVVWGVLRANEPPRQFVEGGEFYVLNVVPYVTKVGDVLEQIEASKGAEGALEQ